MIHNEFLNFHDWIFVITSFFTKRLRFTLHLMKLKGFVSLLNILREYSNITFALSGRSGSIKMRTHANREERVMSMLTLTHNKGEGSYVGANVHA